MILSEYLVVCPEGHCSYVRLFIPSGATAVCPSCRRPADAYLLDTGGAV